jgi:hypothetical protein
VSEYKCNHCGGIENGKTPREVGMTEVYYIGFAEISKRKKELFYHYDCAKEIAQDLLDEI